MIDENSTLNRFIERQKRLHRQQKNVGQRSTLYAHYPEDSVYEACKTGKPANLRFEPAKADSESLPLAMAFGVTASLDGTLLAYRHSLLTVQIEGRHLHQVRDLIDDGKAKVIREFDPERWPEPEEGKPIITKMEFVPMER